MIKRSLLNLKLTVMTMFRNNIRMVLTIVGMSIGLVLFLIGNGVLGSYINSMYEDAYNFDSQSYLLWGDTDDIDWAREQLQYGESKIFKFSSHISTDREYVYDGKVVKNNIMLIGSPESIIGSSVCYYYKDSYYASKTKLLYGRDFLESDNSNSVAIIDKSTSLYLFGKENSIGEKFSINGVYGFHEITIVGVIEDLPSTQKMNFNFNKTVSHKDNSKYQNQLSCYVPNDFLYNISKNTIFKTTEIQNITIKSEEKDVCDSEISIIKYSANLNNRRIAIECQKFLVEEVDDFRNESNGIMSIALIVIILISGFMIFTVLMFSVKERVYEIGVRRALGASRFDILMQFILEGIVIALISSLVSIFISVHSCNFISFVISNVFFIDFSLQIPISVVYSTIGLAVLEGIMFSIVPSIMAAKTDPTEAIRWD